MATLGAVGGVKDAPLQMARLREVQMDKWGKNLSLEVFSTMGLASQQGKVSNCVRYIVVINYRVI
jgi:hypothetical protein